MKYFAKAGKCGPEGLYATLLETHTGKTEAQYLADASTFLFGQKHPRFQVPYAEAVGNSEGDRDMLEYSDDKNPATPDLQMIVNHDDPEREYEYAVEKVNHLAAENNWYVISMKKDWESVFDFSKNE
jgi:hypothetical protein